MRTFELLASLVLTTAACSSDPSSPNADPPPNDAGTDTARDSASPACEVPSEKEALFAYLKAGKYLGFPVESKVHPSDGPHGGNVRTYVTRELEASLRAGSTEHPECAAAVKELYGNGTTAVTGYAVQVKLRAASEGGANWYFYETFDAKDGSSPIEGQGEALCAGCHAAGRDFIRTPYPLQ